MCRDFAVLGYCEKGLDCEHQHVRECPDFAEKGACTTKGCKLPHVIRANRNRPPAPPSAQVTASNPGSRATPEPAVSSSVANLDSGTSASSRVLTAEDGQLGDEFISLTFHESDSDEDDDDDDDDEESEGGEQEDEEGEDDTSLLAVIHD